MCRRDVWSGRIGSRAKARPHASCTPEGRATCAQQRCTAAEARRLPTPPPLCSVAAHNTARLRTRPGRLARHRPAPASARASARTRKCPLSAEAEYPARARYRHLFVPFVSSRLSCIATPGRLCASLPRCRSQFVLTRGPATEAGHCLGVGCQCGCGRDASGWHSP